MVKNNSNPKYKILFLLLLAVLLTGYACTRVEDNTRSGSLLVVSSVAGEIGGDGEESTPLLSDVCDNDSDQSQDPQNCTVFNDNATVSFSNEYLQQGVGAGFDPGVLNDIIVNRYRVDYFRANGRNTPGVDVPYGIDGTMNVRIPIDTTADGAIVVVRHTAKREPPLSELSNGSSEEILTANAQLKFYGQDIAGRTVSAIGYLEIHFANYGEDQ